MDKVEKAKKILDILEKEFPEAKTALNFKTPFQLLIATILSAQTTDAQVNKLTQSLFEKYKNPQDFAKAGLDELERSISSVNFYKNKAKSIKNCSKMIIEDFDGKVPENLEDLVILPGVGRKTANIVLGSAFGKDALAVDTHVKRVAARLGLTESDDPDQIEKDLTAIIPRNRWTKTTSLLIFHGRKTCKAKSPLCEKCPLQAYSVYYREVFLRPKKK